MGSFRVVKKTVRMREMRSEEVAMGLVSDANFQDSLAILRSDPIA